MVENLLASQAADFRVTCVDLKQEPPESVPQLQGADGVLEADPQYLQMSYPDVSALRMLVLWREERPSGTFPIVLVENEPLSCRLGELTLAKLPFRQLKLAGIAPNLPPEQTAFDEVFRYVTQELVFDAISIVALRRDSALWNYLHTSPLIRRHFVLKQPQPATDRQLISLDCGFESYLNHWSAKTRKNRLREIKKLSEFCDVKLVTITQPEQVGMFLACAAAISRKTYQFNLLGTGIRQTDSALKKLQWMAEQGYLRSYLLLCNSEPCAFIYGYQHGGVYTYREIGYDPKWSQYSVGNVLLLKALEDVFTVRKPGFFDLGGYLKYKEMFSTYSYPEANFLLLRRRVYPLVAGHLFLAISVASRSVGNVLGRWGVRTAVTSVIRGLYSRRSPDGMK